MRDRDRYYDRGNHTGGRYYPTHCKPYRTPMTKLGRVARWTVTILVDAFGLFVLWCGVDEWWLVAVILGIMLVVTGGTYWEIRYSYDVDEVERIRKERGLP
jgi:hypothetical protein